MRRRLLCLGCASGSKNPSVLRNLGRPKKKLTLPTECPVPYPHWCPPIRDAAPAESPIRSRLTYLKEGARYGARSDIRRACRKTARRYLRRNYERHPYMAGSPPHPASLGQTSCERPKRCWV